MPRGRLVSTWLGTATAVTMATTALTGAVAHAAPAAPAAVAAPQNPHVPELTPDRLAQDVRFREELGLRADEAYVRTLYDDARAGRVVASPASGALLTTAEQDDLIGRARSTDPVVDAVRAYFAGRPAHLYASESGSMSPPLAIRSASGRRRSRSAPSCGPTTHSPPRPDTTHSRARFSAWRSISS
jgi:hypothetical protein